MLKELEKGKYYCHDLGCGTLNNTNDCSCGHDVLTPKTESQKLNISEKDLAALQAAGIGHLRRDETGTLCGSESYVSGVPKTHHLKRIEIKDGQIHVAEATKGETDEGKIM